MAVLVDDSTVPVDNNLSSPASEGAGELRAIKAKINSLYLNTGVDATYPKLINTARGFNFDVIDGTVADLQATKFRITRSVNAAGKNTHGFTAESALANGVSVGVGFVAGITAFATIGTGCVATAVYALNSGLYQQTHNFAGQGIGLYVQFANRLVAASAAPGGVGTNQYNINAIAMMIDSFPRSSSGEYCGWKYGIRFGANSMDRDVAGPGYCIDFSPLTSSGGADPYAAYKMRGAMKLKEMMGIVWDNAENICLYFDNNTNRFTLRVAGTDTWGVNVTNGNVYKNGALQY